MTIERLKNLKVDQDGKFDKNDPLVQEILIECMLSTKVFCKTLFPDEVSSSFSSLHNEIFGIIDSEPKRKAIAAPRGLGKTTIAKLRVCKAILFREVNFIIYLSNSASNAEMQTENIKRMLQTNHFVKTLFGNIKFGKDGSEDTFSKQAWTAFGDIFVLPRGAGQQVRGLNWMRHRPGLVVIDDLETLEAVRSDEQRDKIFKWFLSDLMKTESRYGDPAEFLYIDTIKHQDSILQRLVDAPDWHSTCLSICDENFNTYDSNYMTSEEIKVEYQLHKDKGETDLFYMELMNIPISLEDAIFKPEYFKYFVEEGDHLKIFEGDNVEYISTFDLITVVIVDPAKTVKLQSADSAVVTISVDRKTHRIFIRDLFSAKVKPDELYNAMFDSVIRFKAFILAYEVTGLNEFIIQPVENEMRIRGIYPQLIELNAKRKKEERIATLAPLYRLGYVYHNQNNCQKLENQLQWFPKSKLKDLMDAEAYITKIMDENSIYFDPEGDFEEPEDYDELEDEELLKGNWRLI